MVHLMATNLLAMRDERAIRPDDLQRCRPRRHQRRIDRTDHRVHCLDSRLRRRLLGTKIDIVGAKAKVRRSYDVIGTSAVVNVR